MSECPTDNDFDGRMGVRISAIFVILIGSFFGTWFPVFAARRNGVGMPSWILFISKYFGSGVIVATAFIHLLAPAHEALTNECLTGPIVGYPWVEGICLMVVFALFVVELMAMRFARFGHAVSSQDEADKSPRDHAPKSTQVASSCSSGDPRYISRSLPNDQHPFGPGSYSTQLTSIFILEFGVIFHSVFIGLTLAVAGDEFNILYIVLVFHQTFEGLALGSRLASIEWPKSKRWTPYWLGIGYAVSTPIAIAVGLGLRQNFAPGSQTTLIVNGVFDSISAGILIYTGLVELMAHEFVFNSYMQQAPFKEVMGATATMMVGAGLMALLGKWA